MRDVDSFHNVENVYMDGHNTNLESERKITMRAIPEVGVSMQNFVVAAHDSNITTLSNITTSQLQD